MTLSAKTLTGVTITSLMLAPLFLAAPASAATVSPDTASMLQAMAAEEKLARDVYLTLGDTYDVNQFTRIASSEQRHLDAVRTLMDRYGVADLTAGDAVGVFDDATVAALYKDLVTEGKQSLTDAANVGITIEKMDIADLDKVIAATSASDITAVLTSLRNGSENHLAAFTRLATGDTTMGVQNGQGRGNGMGHGRGQGQGRGHEQPGQGLNSENCDGSGTMARDGSGAGGGHGRR